VVSLSLVTVLLNLEYFLIYLEVSTIGGYAKFGDGSAKLGIFFNLSGGFYSWRFR
jgi:hypothetical protein